MFRFAVCVPGFDLSRIDLSSESLTFSGLRFAAV